MLTAWSSYFQLGPAQSEGSELHHHHQPSKLPPIPESYVSWFPIFLTWWLDGQQSSDFTDSLSPNSNFSILNSQNYKFFGFWEFWKFCSYIMAYYILRFCLFLWSPNKGMAWKRVCKDLWLNLITKTYSVFHVILLQEQGCCELILGLMVSPKVSLWP